MSKIKSVYSCQKCGYQTPKWMGKCPDCNAWNTFSEETYSQAAEKHKESKGDFFVLTSAEPVLLKEVEVDESKRFETTIGELDRVLGGGLVPASMVLVGGDPGIGKSTLILQMLDKLNKKGIKTLYATGEESLAQVKMRAVRLGCQQDILAVAENALDQIIKHVQKVKPDVLVIDSIQTVYWPHLESAPGSVSQVRECAGKLMYLSKTTGVSTILVGHVTKEGSLAGPRVLEHMVDCVLYFEGDNNQNYRILRTIKNRYGSTNEIGVFEMGPAGLAPVVNPSALFLNHHEKPVPGSAVTASVEGMRPFLVEIQALVSDSQLNNPRRTCLGVDTGRVSMMVAVLEKILGLNLYGQDIYVNAAGGFKINEPACDLAILGALVSSFKNRALPTDILLLGEVGLTGELRGIGSLDIRLSEAHKLGYKKLILPKTGSKVPSKPGLEIVALSHIHEAVDMLFR